MYRGGAPEGSGRDKHVAEVHKFTASCSSEISSSFLLTPAINARNREYRYSSLLIMTLEPFVSHAIIALMNSNLSNHCLCSKTAEPS